MGWNHSEGTQISEDFKLLSNSTRRIEIYDKKIQTLATISFSYPSKDICLIIEKLMNNKHRFIVEVKAIKNAVDCLSKTEKELANLYFVQHKQIEDIAYAFNVSKRTVHRYIIKVTEKYTKSRGIGYVDQDSYVRERVS